MAVDPNALSSLLPALHRALNLAFGGNSFRPFHGEFSSADASALSEVNSRFSLYGVGKLAPLVLQRTDRVVITGVGMILGASALTVTLYDGADSTPSAGEYILKGDFAANGGISQAIERYLQRQSYPKVKTSGAGQIDVSITGIIMTVPDTTD